MKVTRLENRKAGILFFGTQGRDLCRLCRRTTCVVNFCIQKYVTRFFVTFCLNSLFASFASSMLCSKASQDKRSENFSLHRFRQATVTALAMIFVLSPLTACSNRSAEKTPVVSAVHREFERGPAKIILRVDRDEISTADRLNFGIEIVTDNGYEAEMPVFRDKLGEFTIADYQTFLPELAQSNRVKASCSYVLEPFLSGNYTIPPITVKFRSKEAENSMEHEIETDEIGIRVNSVLPEETDQFRINEIAPPISLPRRIGIFLAVLGGIIVFIPLVFLGIFLLKRHRGNITDIEVMRLPHEIALDELLQLAREDLPGKGEIKLFHQRISDILRRYIERRFDIHAPEQTTEEFLENLKKKGTLDKEFGRTLEEFLSHCDLVKFAEHRPDMEEIREIFEICESFIEKTKEENRG